MSEASLVWKILGKRIGCVDGGGRRAGSVLC